MEARVAPGAVNAILEASVDTSDKYLKACLTPLDGNRLLQGVGLDCLEQPLEPRLPLPREDAAALLNQPGLCELLVSAAEEPQAATARVLCHHVWDTLRFKVGKGTSEFYTAASVYRVVEMTLVLITELLLGPPIRMDRNTSDATDKRLRPDFMCWVNGALLFKGEERATEAELWPAVGDLGAKLSAAWDERLLPGVQAPCMLAYVAAGQQLMFFCVKRSGCRDASRPQVQPISNCMALSNPLGRARAITATCNVYRLMMGFARTMTGMPPHALGSVLRREHGTVTLLQGFVRKTIRNFSEDHAEYATFELLRAVYAAMSKPEHKGSIIQARGPGSDGGPTLHSDTYEVHLAPAGVGVSWPPRTERELARAVRGTLAGLAALHAEGFVHRDVRWPNLIELPAEGRWLLVDLEHAGRDGDDCSQPPYPLRYWSSDTLAPNGTYTTASDLKMLDEQLLSDLSFELSSEGCDLRQRLCSGAVSAAEALQHSWFVTHS